MIQFTSASRLSVKILQNMWYNPQIVTDSNQCKSQTQKDVQDCDLARQQNMKQIKMPENQNSQHPEDSPRLSNQINLKSLEDASCTARRLNYQPQSKINKSNKFNISSHLNKYKKYRQTNNIFQNEQIKTKKNYPTNNVDSVNRTLQVKSYGNDQKLTPQKLRPKYLRQFIDCQINHKSNHQYQPIFSNQIIQSFLTSTDQSQQNRLNNLQQPQISFKKPSFKIKKNITLSQSEKYLLYHKRASNINSQKQSLKYLKNNKVQNLIQRPKFQHIHLEVQLRNRLNSSEKSYISIQKQNQMRQNQNQLYQREERFKNQSDFAQLKQCEDNQFMTTFMNKHKQKIIRHKSFTEEQNKKKLLFNKIIKRVNSKFVFKQDIQKEQKQSPPVKYISKKKISVCTLKMKKRKNQASSMEKGLQKLSKSIQVSHEVFNREYSKKLSEQPEQTIPERIKNIRKHLIIKK